MVTGIVIPHETTMAMQRVDFKNLTDYQSAVGGYIDVLIRASTDVSIKISVSHHAFGNCPNRWI